MARIFLEKMEFFAYHGCFKEERVIGNRFIVSLELETNTNKAELTDNLSDTLNYQDVYNTIAEQMWEKSYLLEHLCRRIMDKLVSAYSEIKYLRVKISKLNPPIGGNMESVSIEMEYKA